MEEDSWDTDTGWNPNQQIFHEMEGSYEEHEEHEENTRENEREITQPTRVGHTYARFSKHKEIHDPKSTRDDT